MKKKLLALILAGTMAFSLVGCKEDAEQAESYSQDFETSTPARSSENPFLQASFHTDTVLSGSGKAIGTYGYIAVQRSVIPDFSTEEFSSFFTEFANSAVRDSGYNWVSIMFDDGTGFCFTGANAVIADYGKLDNEGCVTTHLGTCMVSADGSFRFEADTTRSIPDPTILQKALAPNNEFNPVEEIIFNSTAEENGLENTAFYADGKIASRFDMAGYDTVELSTDYGSICISAVLVPLDIDEGDTATVYFVYTGFSATHNCPCGAYVYHEPTDKPQEEQPSPDPTKPAQEEPTAEPSKAAQDEPVETVTTGQRNALSKANQYLSIMAFSHSGLISQLEFEGYTTEEATYGADNCGADWNEQAAKKAQNYIDIMPFSRQGLIDQLKFDGFTQSQAEYGVSAVGY